MDQGKNIQVTVINQDGYHALAQAREHTLLLNVKKGSGEAGFTAAETLIAALGTCLMTNINGIGEKMRLKIDEARIEFTATRSDDPAVITDLAYQLFLKSSESPEILAELFEVSKKWGTVTNTLIGGITPKGELIVEK